MLATSATSRRGGLEEKREVFMNWPIRFLIPLFLILAAAQIGRLQAEGPTANFQQLETIGDSVSASRTDKIYRGDSLNHKNASVDSRVTKSRLDEMFRTPELTP